MNTTIKHYRNSFIDIHGPEVRVWMDPWINNAFEGIWASAKPKSLEYLKKSIKKNPIDYIYISHLHPDHFDIKFLKEITNFQNKKITFLIKNFIDQRLFTILNKNGVKFTNIIKLKPYKTYNLSKSSKFIILPQISSSSVFSKKNIYYDLDTSCIFIDRNVKVFNQVDNPYSLDDLKNVLKKLKNHNIENSFDLSFLSYCGSSEYPCSYLNINRKKEKELIIKKNLQLFEKKFSVINSTNIVPAGGTYKFDGLFSKLNKYLTIPNFDEIKKFLNEKKVKKLLNSNNKYFIFEKKKIKIRNNNYSDIFTSHKTFNKKNFTYNEKIKVGFNEKIIKEAIKNTEKNLDEKLKKKFYNLKTEILFYIYDKQPISIKNLKNYKYKVKHKILDKEGKVKLIVHVYYKTFLAFIEKKAVFNNLQQHCLYERSPNIYEPDAIFWLNYYNYKKL
jgi:L-ascorbate metabolism protein UlaG (beta-lactamase superfamily)